MSDVISDKAKYARGWVGGLPETKCGAGSKVRNTVKQRQWLPEMVEKYGIESIVDIGAGDLNWMRLMEWDVEYSAYDLVPRHKDVIEFDILHDAIPPGDCILLLWVLNHFPFNECDRAIENVLASESRYLIMTDRPIWHSEQPESIRMPYLEELRLTSKGDRMLLIDLDAVRG